MLENSHMANLRKELLTDVADQVAIILTEFNLDQARAEQAGRAVSNHLAEHWGGQIITIPKDHLFKIAERDLEMFDKVNRDNIHEVAKEYGLTVNGLYRAIKRIKKVAVDARQPGLF